MYMYICVYVCMYAYIYKYIYKDIYTYIYIYIHTHTYIYTHTHTYIHLHIHTYIPGVWTVIVTPLHISSTYIHTYIHTYIYIYIHTHTYQVSGPLSSLLCTYLRELFAVCYTCVACQPTYVCICMYVTVSICEYE